MYLTMSDFDANRGLAFVLVIYKRKGHKKQMFTAQKSVTFKGDFPLN